MIDVGTDDTDPFLFVSKGQTGSWATLSYCWGHSPPLKTEIATLKERCEKIPFESMPALFRDAIVLTRRLGYSYLWIDAICIIQDSPSDWTVEAANMGYIYKESSITIVAEASANCKSNFSVRHFLNSYGSWKSSGFVFYAILTPRF